MDLKRIIELQQEQLERYKALKMSCDTCIDNEVIEAQVLAIRYLEENLEMKQDLERLEVLEKEHLPYLQLLTNNAKYQCDNEMLLQENEKLKKAIDILKKYLYVVMDNSGHIINADGYLLKQEYDLLKEVLGE